MNRQLKDKLLKIGRGALISGGAAAAVYLLEGAAGLDLGQWTPFVQAIAGILIQAIRKLR